MIRSSGEAPAEPAQQSKSAAVETSVLRANFALLRTALTVALVSALAGLAGGRAVHTASTPEVIGFEAGR